MPTRRPRAVAPDAVGGRSSIRALNLAVAESRKRDGIRFPAVTPPRPSRRRSRWEVTSRSREWFLEWWPVSIAVGSVSAATTTRDAIAGAVVCGAGVVTVTAVRGLYGRTLHGSPRGLFGEPARRARIHHLVVDSRARGHRLQMIGKRHGSQKILAPAAVSFVPSATACASSLLFAAAYGNAGLLSISVGVERRRPTRAAHRRRNRGTLAEPGPSGCVND